ncbi:hypothetical protein MMC13_004095 [Lambiella insularis]|nr:hypothetical protein [Lambiella insularis]
MRRTLPKSQFPPSLQTPSQAENRKRKRSQEAESRLRHVPADPVPKRHRKSLEDSAVEPTPAEKGSRTPSESKINPIKHWTKEGTWPKEYFEQDDQTRGYLNRNLDEESWFRKYWILNMEHALARRKSSSSLRGKQSQSGAAAPSSTTPSDQKPREEKSTSYTEPRYKILLKTKSSYIDKSDLGITDKSEEKYQTLLSAN